MAETNRPIWSTVKSWFTGEDIKALRVRDIPLESSRRINNIPKKTLTPTEKVSVVLSSYNAYIIGAAKMIADAVSQSNLELKLKNKTVENEFSVKLKNRIARNDTYRKFISEMVTNYVLNSDSYAIILREDDKYGMDSFKTLRPIDKSFVTVKSDPETDEAVYQITDPAVRDSKNTVHGYNMIHFSNISTNGLTSIDIVNTVLGDTLKLQDVSDKSIKDKLSKPVTSLFASNRVQVPIDAYDPEKRALYQTYLEGLMVDREGNEIDYSEIDPNAAVELDIFNDQMRQLESYQQNWSFLLFDEDNLDLKLHNIDPKIYDITPIEDAVRSRIEKVFNFPAGYLSLSATSTAYSEVYDQFLRVTVQPILKMIESELTRKLLTDEEYLEGWRIEYERDLTTEEIHTAFRNGYITSNQAARKLGFEEVDDDAHNTHWVSGDMKPLGKWYETAVSDETVET